MTFGEKYTEKDVTNFFNLVPVEDGHIPAKYCGDMLTGKLKQEDE